MKNFFRNNTKFILASLFLFTIGAVGSFLIFRDLGSPETISEIEETKEIEIKDFGKVDKEKIIVYYEDNPDVPQVIELDEDDFQDEDSYRQKLSEISSKEGVRAAQPNYIYETQAWQRSGTQDYPGTDFDLTPTAATGNHWYYELGGVRDMWYLQDCFNSGEECGGSSDVTVAVIDTGLAFETREDFYGNDFEENNDMFGASDINLYVNSDETANNNVDDDGNGVIDDRNGFDAAQYVYCRFYAGTCPTAAEQAEEGHPNDDGGHGTYTTGLISSLVDNSTTGSSVSPGFNLTIMPIKASFYKQNSFGTLELLEAIDYAVDNGADIINMSLAGPSFDSALNTKLEWAEDQGVISIAATGNQNTNVYYPAAFDSVIGVGSVNADGTRSFYSNYGAGLDFTAYTGNGGGEGDSPFQRSYSCFFTTPNCYSTSNYSAFSTSYRVGTSFASPQVAALAGLMKSIKPDITKQGVFNYIRDNTIDLNTVGWDTTTGWGAIDFGATYAELQNQTEPTISIVQPDGVGDNADLDFLVTWTDSDPEDDALIDLFWDTDNSGFDGRAIDSCQNISEDSATDECTAVLTTLPDGDYYIYGCIVDDPELHAPVCDYSDGTVSVDNTLVMESGKSVVTTDLRTVTFQETYEYAPAVFATITSEIGGDAVIVNVTQVTTAGFSLQMIENTASSWDGSHMPEEVSWMAVQSSNDEMQIGFENVDSNWRSISFVESFSTIPKIMTLTQTENGADISQVDIRNTTTNGFEMRVEELPGFNGIHLLESLAWIAYEDISGTQNNKISINHNWQSVTFPTPYSEPPIVLTDVNTEVGTDPVQVDIRNLSSTGFEARLEEDIKVLDGTHANEEISWISMEYSYIVSQSGITSVNNSSINIPFAEPFATTPKVLVDVISENGGDTIDVDILWVTNTFIQVRLEEDLLAGWDGSHTFENISWYAFMETPSGVDSGYVNINSDWTYIEFNEDFTSTVDETPKVFADINTENGTDTAQVDIRDITDEGFDIRVEEDVKVGWNGIHLAEGVTWLAFETEPTGEAGEASIGTENVNIDFSPSFSTVPKVFFEIQTEQGSDSVQVDISSLTTGDFFVRLEEEPKKYDGVHAIETIAWWAFE
jgi:hypothetical protein